MESQQRSTGGAGSLAVIFFGTSAVAFTLGFVPALIFLALAGVVAFIHAVGR